MSLSVPPEPPSKEILHISYGALVILVKYIYSIFNIPSHRMNREQTGGGTGPLCSRPAVSASSCVQRTKKVRCKFLSPFGFPITFIFRPFLSRQCPKTAGSARKNGLIVPCAQNANSAQNSATNRERRVRRWWSRRRAKTSRQVFVFDWLIDTYI